MMRGMRLDTGMILIFGSIIWIGIQPTFWVFVPFVAGLALMMF